MKTKHLLVQNNPLKGLFSIILLFLITSMALNAQVAELPMHYESYSWDFNKSPDKKTEVLEHTVEIPNAVWLRLYFTDVNLGSESYVTITSLQDRAQQTLYSSDIKEWGNSSAYFNGNKLLVELFKSPKDKGVSLQISEVEVGDEDQSVTLESICGVDNRVLSSDKAIGRIMPIGCTGWIIRNGKHVTAGHCTGSRMNVLEFNVPLSASNGAVRHPGPEHQYTVNKSSVKKGSKDWAVFSCNNNSITGKSTIAAQGKSFNVVKVNSVNTIRITGYGVDGGNRNQVQQTHTGPYSSSNGSKIYYSVDTQGGNSGSPVIDNSTGNAVGVHTHGGCTSGGGTNSGTDARLSAFWNAMGLGGSSGAPIGKVVYFKGNNGKYVSSNNGSKPIRCDRPAVHSYEKFTVVNAGGGLIALKGNNGKYVSSENGGSGMTCNRSAIGSWEKFAWVAQASNKVALRGNNGKYVSSENGGKDMTCNRSAIGSWEIFGWATTTKAAEEPDKELTNSKDNYTVYPNPVNRGVLHIENNVKTKDINLKVINLQGQTVLSKRVNGTTIDIDLSEISKGYYMLLLESSQNTETHKIIIE